MREQRAKLSRHNDLAKRLETRWDAFARFLAGGQTDLTNNAAERFVTYASAQTYAWTVSFPDRFALLLFAPCSSVQLFPPPLEQTRR